ncbi:MAG: ADP-ribosylglycohydrolase [Sulfobacillus benefaciens]|uniref:ADP-ribosylglycohydrolase n=1 Tax=Sulfobacillus benefaciens TaxID=453960 RepID=A0A2T2X080_9FIRM|nr:MAG: ADP-ribosylglycohydrolase [Sulfobacillus benefaciens]
MLGLAAGDAMGMPTQMLSRSQVLRLFPQLSWFQEAPPENPISAGLPAGRITDDTEQALMVAKLLVTGKGSFDGRTFAEQLTNWAQIVEQGGNEQLGPSSRRALDNILRGIPLESAGRWGTTNGAAMRIAPVGIACCAKPAENLVNLVTDVAQVTHNTGLAISGASAVASFIAATLDGEHLQESIRIALAAAKLGSERGYYAPGPSLADRIEWALNFCTLADDDVFLDILDRLVGTGVATEQSVPTAFALVVRWPTNPWRVITEAARLGGDSDTIGAIAGAMAGAQTGIDAFPSNVLETIEQVNHLSLASLAQQLLELRHGRERG